MSPSRPFPSNHLVPCLLLSAERANPSYQQLMMVRFKEGGTGLLHECSNVRLFTPAAQPYQIGVNHNFSRPRP